MAIDTHSKGQEEMKSDEEEGEVNLNWLVPWEK